MKILRALSDIEAAFHYMHEMGNGSTQVVTAARVNGDFESTALSAKLRKWAARHEVLNIAIHSSQTDSEHEELFFYRKPYQPEQLTIHQESQGVEHQQLFITEINTPLQADWPWRLSVIIVPKALYIYFTRSHVISDAFTTRVLLQSLLEIILWNVSTGLVTKLIPNRSKQPLKRVTAAPAGESTLPLGIASNSQRHCTISPIAGRQTKILRRTLDRKLSAAIITTCKARGITLNECFAAALAEAYASSLGIKQVELYTAINSRRHFDEALASGLGCNIHVLKCPMKAMPLPLDSQAIQYRSALSKASSAWAPSPLRYSDIKLKVSELCAADIFLGPCITNSGISDFTSAIYRQVDFVETAVNRNIANYSVVLHLSSFRGRLHLLYSYASPAMPTSIVKEIDYALMTKLGLLETSLPGQQPLARIAQ